MSDKLVDLMELNPRLKKAVAYVGRVEILQMINEKPMYCEEIAMVRDQKPSGVFQHAKQLEQAGLIQGYREESNDRNVLYKVTPFGLRVLKLLE